jgi:preprotein translocase subunit SecB
MASKTKINSIKPSSLVITPEEYRKLQSNIDLVEISLFNSTSSLILDSVNTLLSAEETPFIKLNDSANVLENEKAAHIINKWSLTAKFKESGTSFLNIKAEYSITLAKTEKMSKEFWNIYKNTTLHIIVYPYFREFVQSLTSRMNIPPLTLPILFK